MKEILLIIVITTGGLKMEKKPAEDLPPDAFSSSSTIDLRTELPSADIPEVLEEAGGITSRDFSGTGSFSHISLRGGSASDTPIFIEDIPVMSFRWGIPELSSFPVWLFEKAEIYKTSLPTSFPLSGVGGAVNLRIKKNLQGFRLNAYGGSFSSGGGSVVAGYSNNLWKGVVGGGYDYTKGNFPFKSDNGTPFNYDDDYINYRKNNEKKLASSYLFFEKNSKSLLTSYTLLYSFLKTGIPGFYSHQTEKSSWTSHNLLLGGDISFKNFLPLRISFHLKGEKSIFSDPLSEVGLLYQDERSLVGEGSLNALYFLKKDKNRLIFSLSSLFSNIDGEDILLKDSFYFNLFHLNAGGEWEREIKKRFRFVLKLREEIFVLKGVPLIVNSQHRSTFKQFTSPSLGFLYLINQKTVVFSNFGLYFKPPSLAEIAGDRGFITGNSALPPENSYSGEVGLKYVSRNAFVVISAFSSLLKKAHIFIQNSQFTVKPEAVGEALKAGFEANGRYKKGPFKIAGALTVLYTQDRGKVAYWRGNRLPGQPLYFGILKLSCLLKYAEFTYKLKFEGEKYLDRANGYSVGPYHIHSLILNFFLSKKEIVVRASFNNLFDQNQYDYFGYPLPGRSLFFSITYNLKIT